MLDDFIWGNLKALYWMLAVPLLLVVCLYGLKTRKKIIAAFMDISLQKRFIDASLNRRRVIRIFFLLLAVLMMVFSLMRPKWGFFWEKSEQKGIDIVIALDISKSMLATDISPSRYQRSIFEIKNLLKILDGDRISLIPFTSRAFIQCPLTTDYRSFGLFLDMLEPGRMAGGGTSLRAALYKAIEAFDEKYKKHRILIIMTDGEGHDESIDDALKMAKEKGIRIFTIGFGSTEGSPIILENETGNSEYIKDSQGNIVLSKLNADVLKKLAVESNGAYVPANLSVFSLEELFLKEIKQLEGRRIDSTRKKRFKERFYIPLMFSFIFCLAGFILGR